MGISAEKEIGIGEADSRNQLQKTAMAAIYDMLTYVSMGSKVNVEGIVSGLCDKPYEDCDYFVKACLIYAIKAHDEAIASFNALMNHWTFDRLNRVEQAILLLSYVHFYLVEPGVDKGIVIDVAVKLSKSYLDASDYKFVNAILDKVLVKPE